MKIKSCIPIAIILCANSAFSQNQIKLNFLTEHIKLWDLSFNKRDTITLFRLADSAITITAGGGTELGMIEFKKTVTGLYTDRRELTMKMTAAKVELSEWPLGYDSGDWIETWFEKSDNSKNQIKGKYWRMWKIENDTCKVMAIILTPMSWNK